MYRGEKLNAISHLVGTVLALMGMGALITVGVQVGDPWVLTSFVVFGVSLVLLYAMSTLYHSFYHPELKQFFKLMDHVAIYILIAGSYTPYMLVSLRDGNGWHIMSAVWGLAIIGILSEIFLKGKAVKIAQIIIYLMMGWACSVDISSLKGALPETGFNLLVAGGVAYTVGVVFYIWDKVAKTKHTHGVWHLFVLAGSICHFSSIIGYVR